jgi:GntR family transcriptional regulator
MFKQISNFKEKIMDLKLDYYSSIPLHFQIEKILRELIKEEEFKNGKMLPTETELSLKFGTSRNTVRQAINKLASEGLIIRKKGIGTFILQNRLYSKVSNWFSFTKELQSRGMTAKTYDTHIEFITPPIEVAAFFNIHSKVKVLKLERIRGNEQLPFVYFVSYFNPSIPLTGDEDYSIPLYEMIERDYNVNAKLSREELTAITANKEIAEKLNVKKKSAILLRQRQVFDQEGFPIEFNIGYYIGEIFTYILESERKV